MPCLQPSLARVAPPARQLSSSPRHTARLVKKVQQCFVPNSLGWITQSSAASLSSHNDFSLLQTKLFRARKFETNPAIEKLVLCPFFLTHEKVFQPKPQLFCPSNCVTCPRSLLPQADAKMMILGRNTRDLMEMLRGKKKNQKYFQVKAVVCSHGSGQCKQAMYYVHLANNSITSITLPLAYSW